METRTLGPVSAGAAATAKTTCARTRQIAAAATFWSRFETKNRASVILRSKVRKMGAPQELAA